MKLLVIGKRASVTHWLEDCVDAWRVDGHDVRVAATRNPALHPAVERLLLSPRIGAPMAGRICRLISDFSPHLIIAVGAYHISVEILERIAALPSRAPIVGWVGDVFGGEAIRSARLLDVVAYTDSGFLELHTRLGIETPRLFLPHAADPHLGRAMQALKRRGMVFLGNPTDHRRRIVAGLRSPISLYGPGWTAPPGTGHTVTARRIAKSGIWDIYARHLACLNIRNELNVVSGLNQRNFEPCLMGAAVVAEAQPDLELCFDIGREVLAYHDIDELNAIAERVAKAPGEVGAVGLAGRDRVLSQHTYGRRLEALAAAVRG